MQDTVLSSIPCHLCLLSSGLTCVSPLFSGFSLFAIPRVVLYCLVYNICQRFSAFLCLQEYDAADIEHPQVSRSHCNQSGSSGCGRGPSLETGTTGGALIPHQAMGSSKVVLALPYGWHDVLAPVCRSPNSLQRRCFVFPVSQ